MVFSFVFSYRAEPCSRPQKQHRFLSFEKFYQTSLETQCYEDRNCSFEEFSERAEDEGFDQARTETKGEQLLNTVPYNTIQGLIIAPSTSLGIGVGFQTVLNRCAIGIGILTN